MVSFRDRDYLDGDGTPLKEAVVRFCAERGAVVERVLTLTQLRVLGYVFNPVTFHWCYGPDGRLAGIVAELAQHLRRAAAGAAERAVASLRARETAPRVPLLRSRPDYEYAFSEPEEELWARIHVREGAKRPLTAVLHLERRELTNASLARMLARYPLMPLRVATLIHWQALKLFAKRVPFHRKPPFVPGEGSVRR